MRNYVAFAKLPEEERAIGRRVRDARKRGGLSQAKLAILVSLTRDQLANIEVGRTALRFETAWNLCSELRLNPLWLASGEGDRHGFVDMPGATDVPPGDLFSSVMDDLSQEDPYRGWPGYEKYRDEQLHEKRRGKTGTNRRLKEWLDAMTPEQQDNFWSTIERAARDFVRYQQEDVKRGLTERAALSSLGSMRVGGESLWPALRERIRKLVRVRGRKSELARKIGVSRQAINAMLSASRKKPYVPSGEYTLRLMAWAAAAEAQQKKRTGSAETRPAQGTRKSKNEKAKSSQKRH